MKDVVLCGYTGSNNRGSEAIIKSTLDIMKKYGIETILATHKLEQDKLFNMTNFKDIVEYVYIDEIKRKNIIKYIYIGIQYKIFKNKYPLFKAMQNNIFKTIQNNLILNVGGDTYCYDTPYLSYTLNKYASKNNIPNVLWGCSIEKDLIDNRMLKDLNRYKMIFPRETITYNNLIEKGIDEKKLFYMCDPAFTLESEIVKLPLDFENKKIVGINISPLILKCSYDENTVYENIYNTIDYILQNTNMNIALIPHVYTENTEDIIVLKKIYEKYINTNRIINFDKFYNCRQLKYIISKCSFLIAARTHASIAAYSSFIPTLVIGYSVKSKGIAKDLFGEYENYVIPVQILKEKEQLCEKFKWILENENSIIKKLKIVIPGYVKKAYNAGVKIKEIAEEKEIEK